MQVRPVETANETFGESCPWGFILGRKRQKRGKCGESFPRQRAQVQTDGGIWVRGKYINEMICRHSVNQCFVPWMKTLFGALENRSDSVLTSNEFLGQGLSCEGCKMTLHKWCYNKVIDYCPKSVWVRELLLETYIYFESTSPQAYLILVTDTTDGVCVNIFCPV